jgi:acyl-coenzyme A thioesterase PaaI-like protein
MDDRQLIRDQVLRGIALNREPGYHFTGNFLDISYDRVAGGEALLSLDTGPRCTEADGQMSLGAIAVLADLTLAATVRAGLDPATRLATVTMNLNFTGVPLTGLLEAAGEFQGFIAGAAGRQGLSRVSITTGGERACFGTGAFMVLKPPKGVELHPVPKRRRGEIEVPAIDETRLKRDERRVLERADATLTAGSSAFLRRFWGFEPHHIKGGASCAVKNGPHIGNRVGHAQGGFLIGMAAATAAAALPATWQLTGISAWYISPGEGRILRARSKIVHHGRIVSVVRTQVTGKHSRLVLDVTTTHAHRAA